MLISHFLSFQRKVVMKIVKHSQENMPELVTGLLLGMDNEDVLEVTNCFPLPNGLTTGTNVSDAQNYQLEMMNCLKQVNVDYYTVGWFASTYLGSFVNNDLIHYQYSFQSNASLTNKTVVLIYDQMKTVRSGALSLRALRLSDSFFQLHGGKITQEK